LALVRESVTRKRFVALGSVIIDPVIAREKARHGDLAGAIELARAVVEDDFASGEMMWLWWAVTAFVESLLDRGTDADLREARAAIDRLASVPTDPGFVLHELPLLRLRGLLARAHGDEAACQEFMERLCVKATAAGFEPLAAAAAATKQPAS
jgi:adenylate cyclase